MAKHYVRTDDKKRIIKIFSDKFEQPIPGDICVNENGGRHFNVIDGYHIINDKMQYQFEYKSGKAKKRKQEDMDLDADYLAFKAQMDKEIIIALQTRIDAGEKNGYDMTQEINELNLRKGNV